MELISDFRSSFFFEDERITEILCTDKELDKLAGDYRCDIIFYKEHADFVKNSVKVIFLNLLGFSRIRNDAFCLGFDEVERILFVSAW